MLIDVLGRQYTIRVVNLPKNLYGDCDHDKAVIRLSRRLGDLSETLVHEVIHASLAESGVKYLLDVTDGLEEAVVRAVEHGLRTAGLIAEVDFDDLAPGDTLADDTGSGSPEDPPAICQGDEIPC